MHSFRAKFGQCGVRMAGRGAINCGGGGGVTTGGEVRMLVEPGVRVGGGAILMPRRYISALLITPVSLPSLRTCVLTSRRMVSCDSAGVLPHREPHHRCDQGLPVQDALRVCPFPHQRVYY